MFTFLVTFYLNFFLFLFWGVFLNVLNYSGLLNLDLFSFKNFRILFSRVSTRFLVILFSNLGVFNTLFLSLLLVFLFFFSKTFYFINYFIIYFFLFNFFLGFIFFIFFSFIRSKTTFVVSDSSFFSNHLFNLLFAIFFYSVTGLTSFEFCSFFDFSFFYFWGSDLFTLGLDLLSLFFVLLTVFIVYVAYGISYKNFLNFTKNNYNIYVSLLLLIEFFLVLTFSARSLLFFYFLFEVSLFPMVFLISRFGSKTRRFKASQYLLVYTVLGSIPILFSLFYLYSLMGSFSFMTLFSLESFFLNGTFSETLYLVWFLIFFGLAIKVPMFPLHIWLPEAHVEAPTAGSVILAGVVLKVAGYGFIRVLFFTFPSVTNYFLFFVLTLAFLSLFIASILAVGQVDMKRLVAYSSIAHMNVAVLGFFGGGTLGIIGAIILSLAHGFVSSALFILVGGLYERFGSRLINYYGGLSGLLPRMAFFFFFFMLANISMPPSLNFIAEFQIFTSLIASNIYYLTIFSLFFSVFFSAVYSVFLYNRVFFGELNLNIVNLQVKRLDFTFNENFFIFLLVIPVVFFGFYPSFLNFCCFNMLRLLYV